MRTVELELNGVTIDTGYGDRDGDLILELQPVLSTDAYIGHNGAGDLQNYEFQFVSDVEFVGGTIFLVGNNGQELGEIELDCIEDVYKLGYTKDELVELVRRRL